ncbi:MAG: tRNA(fMet)-specific endonuclease VapC [Blastocatellia bacterium]|jgi:tRNA(fMet)-specific endonuclease VapC|nr:tRNA(fMet)-specific endonuclease VapC [Blastocatellia bacterium]
MRYLLDTNMVSDLVRNPQGEVAARIAHIGEESVCTSIIVAAELRYGAARKGSARLLAQSLTVLDAFEILPFETPAEITYGDLRARLEAAGKPIGGNDMLIAAQWSQGQSRPLSEVSTGLEGQPGGAGLSARANAP